MLKARVGTARPGLAPAPVYAHRAYSRTPRRRCIVFATAAVNAAGEAKTGGAKTWQATVGSSAPLEEDNSKNILFRLVDRSGLESSTASLNDWRPAGYLYDKEKKGWKRYGDVIVPEKFTEPVALRLCKECNSKNGKKEDALDYVSEFRLDMGSGKVTFPVHSWISSDHDWRVFFGPDAYLPADTPEALVPFRQQDMAELRGETPKDKGRLADKRQGADRIYGYQAYNDLGSAKDPRPTLGDANVRPYPRRIATNRRVLNGQEVSVAEDPCDPPEKGPWMPYDERFNFSKQQGFAGDAVLATLPAAVSGITHIPPWKLAFGAFYQFVRKVPVFDKVLPPMSFPPYEDFESIQDVMELYGQDIVDRGGTVEQLMGPVRRHLYAAGSDAAEGRTTDDGLRAAANRVLSATSSRKYKTDGAWQFELTPAEATAAEDQAIIASAGPSLRRKLAAPNTGAPAVPSAGTPGTEVDVNTLPFINLTAASAPIEADPKTLPMVNMISAAPTAPGGWDVWQYIKGQLRNAVAGGEPLYKALLKFPVPRSLEGRPIEWALDVEMGRQALAGMHPCSIAALKEMPSAFGSAIRNEHIKGDLQGSTLEELVAEAAAGGKPRLYIMDYWGLSAFWDQMRDDGNMVQHAGRAVFYLRRRTDARGKPTDEDEALIPVAIELAHRGNHKDKAGVVYSRCELCKNQQTVVVWRLAKAVFRSMDSAYHQLISHWLRTHACMEPFLIAMRRQLSFMHPVLKLMLPHFRYTMHINANARSSLVNAGGIIEKNFSAGEFAMRLSSVVYRSWRFRTQSLPDDLKERGMVDPATGNTWCEYPYAEDGMDLWNAFDEYFTAFASRYYKNDEALLQDAELQAWWKEAKTEGHGDLAKFGYANEQEIWGFGGKDAHGFDSRADMDSKDFDGRIATREHLVRILTTIAFTASAHHAAVNFGQYDYSGLLLNFSSMVRKPMPVPGDKAWQELVSSPPGVKQERLVLTWLSHVVGTVSVMTTVKLLSNHAVGEQTLEQANKYLMDPADKKLNNTFTEKVLALEKKFEARNADPHSWTRKSMGYDLMLPTSGAGVTGRGVPYSVSI